MWCARTTQKIASRRSSSILAGTKGNFRHGRQNKSNDSSFASRRFLSTRPQPREKSQQEIDADSLPTLELHEMTMETHLRNFATAVALTAFCGGVYYYTALQAGSVQRRDRDAVDELRLEAKEALLTQRQRKLQRDQMVKTLQPEFGNPELEGEVQNNAILAAAAPADVAQQEEQSNYELLKKNGPKKK
jgi:hypothetical protein